jgi:hypothetical protein
MTRKDYKLIAKPFNDLSKVIELKGTVAENLIKMLADDLQADNPRFNRKMFLTACGLKEAN